MSRLKKTLIIIGALILLLIAVNFGTEYYISKKLPQIIASNKGIPYNLKYDDIDINLLSGNFTVYNAYVSPKDSMYNAKKQGIFCKIGSIEIKHLNLWKLLRKSNIDISRINIDTPDVHLYPQREPQKVDDTIKKAFENRISTKHLNIKNGSFIKLDTLEKPSLAATHINFELNDIEVDSTALSKNIPISYKNYALACDSIYYNAGKYYNITLARLNTTDSTLTAYNFSMIPKHSRKDFTNIIPVEKDQYTVKADSIAIKNLDWGFNNDTLYLHTPEITLQNVFANVYRSKEPKDDTTIKKLYSQLLREIKFDLKADKLMLKNSVLEYEEQNDFSRPPAKVEFSQFYATVYNIYSPIGKQKLPDTKVDVQCLFMKSAPLRVNWTFNPLDISDAFTIHGHLQNVESKRLNKVSKPLMNVTTDGLLKEIKFTFNGNRESGNGQFAINYKNMQVQLYKKDGSEKNGLKSILGNLVVKNGSDGELKQVDVSVDREKDKSVFNFLWLFIKDGLKQTLLPKILS